MSTKRFPHAATFAAATAIASIMWALIVYLASMNQAFLNFSYVIVITGLCIGVKKWREQSGGYLTFGGTYAHLILQSLVYSVIMAIWTYIFTAFIAPGFFESQLLKMEMEMEEQGQPQQAIDMAMKWSRWIFQPAVMSVMALLGVIVYALIDLIIAAIMKKDPPPAQFFPPTDVPPQNGPYGTSPYGQNPYSNQPPPNFPPQQ